MAFDIDGARKAGYSDTEIAQHLAQSRDFDIAGARKAGYTDGEIAGYLSGLSPKPTVMERAKSFAGKAVDNLVSAIPGMGGNEQPAPQQTAPQLTPAAPTAQDSNLYAQVKRDNPGASDAEIAAKMTAITRAQQPAAPAQPTPDQTVKPYDFDALDGAAKPATPDIPLPTTENVVGSIRAPGVPQRPGPTIDALRQQRTAELRQQIPQADDRTISNIVDSEILSGQAGNVGTVSNSNFDFDTHQKYKDAGTIERGIAKGVNSLEQSAAGLHEFIGDSLGLPDYTAAMKEKGNELGREADAIGDRSQYLTRNWEGAVSSIVSQTPGLAVSALSGGSVPLLMMGLQQFGGDYHDGRAAGLSQDDATKRAAINGVAEIIGEKIGMPSFTKVFKDVTKGAPTEELVKDLAKHVLMEVPGEELTTAIEFANDKFPGWAQNKQATLQDYLQQAADTLVQTVMQAGAMGSTGVAGNAIHARGEQSATVAADVARANALDQWSKAFTGNQSAQPDSNPATAPAPAQPAAPAPSRLDHIRQQVAARKEQIRQEAGIPPAASVPAQPADELDQDQLLNEIDASGTPSASSDMSGEQHTERPAEPQPTPAEIDTAAHAAATSPKNDLPEPTDAQKEAGNYQKGHVTLHGLDISIENPAGSTRSGVDENGKAWETTLANHYGYVKRTTGADGDQVDVFIGDKPESQNVYVVDQINPKTGAFDEHKAMLGFDSKDSALAAYHANYDKGWQGAKAITEMSVDQFKGWLKNGDTTKPMTKEEDAAQPQQVAGEESPAQGAQAEGAQTGLSVGTTPNNAEPVTVRNGIVHVGDYPAMHFETGEDVTVPAGADHAQVAQALRDAGVLSSKQRIFGLPKAAPQPKPTRAQQIKQQVKAKAETSDEMADRSRKSFIRAIKAMGGISVAEARDIAGEPAHIANRMAPGLFRKDGNALDLVARRLNELGYLSDAHYNDVDGGVQKVRELVGQALAGEPVMTDGDAQRYAELSAREQEQENAMPAADEALADMIVSETPDDDLLDLGTGASDTAESMRLMGFTEEEINAEISKQAGQDHQAAGGPAPGTPEGRAGTGENTPANEGFALEGQTPQQLKRSEQIAKEAAAAKAKSDAAVEAKAKADAERDSFTLTGSDRAADANPGQADIFSQPAAKSEPKQNNGTAPEHATVGVDDRELGEIVDEFNRAQHAEIEDGEKVTHVFAPPAKGEVVRLGDKAKVYHKEHGWMTPAEARAKIEEWKEHAAKQGGQEAYRNGNAQRVVLSLFDLSGEWSKPWEDAGYQVFRFDIQDDPEVGDVNNFSTEFFNDWFGSFDGQDIYAVLAACPCTDFAVSGARHFAAKDADGRTVASVKLVHQTLATIEYFKPAVWAIENPVGRIEKMGGLPPWRLSFDPNHLGDPYTKKTLLWGRFNGDLPVAPVEPTEGSKMHRLYGGKSMATKNARSVTPEGFAYAFFMANNAADHPAMAIANKYDRLDRGLIERAVKAGVTEEQIDRAVEDNYYGEMDDAAANDAIRALIPADIEQGGPGPLVKAMNDLAETRAKIEAQGNVVDDRLLEKERKQRALVKELEAEQKPAVSANTVFTEDAAAAARALLKKKLSGSQLNSGIDPEVMQAGITLAGYHIEKGARSFAAYAKAMLDDLGDVVKPYLKSWYVAIKFDPRASSFSADMDGMADVEKASIEATAAEKENPEPAPTSPQFADARWDAATPAERKALIEQAGRADIAENYKSVAWADLSDNMRARLALEMSAPIEPAAPKPVTPQVVPNKAEASPASDEFKKGDRVQIKASHYHKDIAGRHGEIVDTHKTTWTKSVLDLTGRGLGLTEQSKETHVYHDVKTDGGHIAKQVPADQIEPETSRVQATPDPVVDGEAIPPGLQQQRLKASRDASRNYGSKSDAARKPEKKDEWRSMALAEDAKTAKLMKAWAAWVNEHPDAAAMMGEAAPAATPQQAAPTDTSGILSAAGIAVKASQTKNGTQTWEVSGNTKEHMDVIKRLGGRWYGPKKVWSFYKADPSEQLAQALAGSAKAEPSRVSAITGEVTTQAQADMRDVGAKAFADGKPRTPPEFMGASSAKEWLAGWDAANLAAPSGEPATLNAEPNDAEHARIPEQARPEAGNDQADRGDGAGREPGSRPLGGRLAEADARAGEGGRTAAGSETAGGTGAAGDRVRAGESLGGRDREPSTDGNGSESAASGAEPVALPSEPKTDFTVDEDTAEAISEGGQKTKARNNIAAIKLVKKLVAEDRRATVDEQKVLAKYVGWGGIKQLFDEGKSEWSALRDELKSILTAEEYAAARRSILDAHFTSMDVVSGMWGAAKHLGFNGGRVIEPSVGVGNFFGAMPKELRANSGLFGVELDNITGAIAKFLYPNATIATPAGFQDVELPSNSFDFATGNPPFGEQSLFDPAHPEFKSFSIHQFFFAKALDKVRPGGILQMVVSRYLMDSRDAAGFAAREYLSKHARLLGAIRLPYSAFLGNANTEVVTDIVFLQKLADGEAGNPGEWTDMADVETVHPKTGERFGFTVNRYFADHPEMIVGTQAPTGKMRQANQYNVEPPSEPLAIALGRAIANLPRDVYMGATTPLAEIASADAVVPDGTKVYGYYLDGETVMQRTPDSVGQRQARAVEYKDGMGPKRAARMIQIRDTLRSLMRAELSKDSTDAEIASLRAELNRQYDAFRKQYGYINQPANRRAFRDDPDLPLLESLEPKFDPGIGAEAAKKRGEPARKPSAEKADIFKKRVLQPMREVKSVESAKDALVVSLNERGRIDPDHMAEIYGKPWDEIRQELGDLIYPDPSGAWETADAYLSGNVKAKLKAAIEAAKRDPQTYANNVPALEAVQPPDVPALKISVRLGSPWVPSEDMNRFAAELFGARNHSVRFVKQVAKWSVTVPGGEETARLATWGTRRVPAEDVLEHVLNNKPIVVKDNLGTSKDPNWVVNETETEAARAKAQDMAAKFKEWIWQDPERRGRLERIYNDNYNTDVRRKYDGSHLTLPGSNPAIQLRPHQKAAVWRAIQDRTILLDHVVGAGKTFEKAAIAMELRRLGIARKPMFMVPNSLVRQWRDEFYKLYPNANVLAATEADFAKANRRRFMAKIATGDWDAVIVAHSSFKKIGMPAETEKAILTEQLNEIADAIEEIKRERGDRNVMRDMERMKEKIAERLKGLASKGGKKDDTVTFDELGADALLLDEAHLFKNLFYTSSMRNVAGLGNPNGSGRAFDLFVKLRYLDQRYASKAPVVFATGTPVSNSLVEMFTMQRYLAWNKLKDAGMHMLDAWAGVYGDVQNVYEVHPSGTGYRLSTRFAKFVNLPSLMDLYRGFADVVTMDDLKAQAKASGGVFPVPKIRGGRPENIVADRSDQQTHFFGVPEFVRNPENGDIVFELPGAPQDYSVETDENGKFYIAGKNKQHSATGKTYETYDEAHEDMVRLIQTPKTQWNQGSILWKFENLKQLNKDSKGKINALSITNEARKAGLDFRLIDSGAPDFAGSKVNMAVANALRIHKEWADDRGTQLIFCDLSVPQSARTAAASKERDAFVRNDDGSLQKVKATVASLDGVERAFLVVKRGAKENVRFSVYDGATGADLGIEEASRADAVKALAHAFETGPGMADKLEQFSPIDDAEIADWKDANEQEAPEDDSESDDSISVSELVGMAGGGKFSVYDDIKAKLLAGGVPENEIAFIHDYDTAAKKNDLFKKVNAGEIRILLGSTEKMGAGMNVQERLVGLHHLDAPWRPSDLEQREGRIVRQGNALYKRDPDGFEVQILRYGTRQTYDTRMWQIIEHKAAGVEQLRKAADDLLEIDDVGGEAANAADMKAAASGNPLILEEIKLRNEVKSLEAQQFGHMQAKVAMQDKIAVYRRAPERMRRKIAEIAPFREAAEANPPKPFSYTTPKGKTVGDPKGATTPISEAFVLAAKGVHGDHVDGGVYRGMTVQFYKVHGEIAVDLEKDGQSMWVAGYSMEDKFSPSGLFTRIDNAVSKLGERENDIRAEADRKAAEIPKLEAEVDKPFAKEAELKEARQKHREVVSKLAKAGGGIELSPEMKAELKLALVQRMIEGRNGVASPNVPYVAEPGEAGYSDPYASLETRPNTRPEQLAEGRQALADAERRIFGRNRAGMPGAPSLLGSRISAEFRANGNASLVGQTARTAHDLALAAQILRDPRFETFRFFYVDAAGKIVGERAYSSRMAGSVSIPAEHATHVREDMQRLNATGYWMLHNHPSGSATESDADRKLTANVARMVKGFLGHVVIDHNEYNSITLDGMMAVGNVVKAPELASIDLTANPEKSHPLLGEVISGPSVLAGIAKRLQQKNGYVVLIGTDGHGRIAMLTEVPVNMVNGASKNRVAALRATVAVKRAARETGSMKLFAAVPGNLMEYGAIIDSGMFTDVVQIGSGESAHNYGLLKAGAGVPKSAVESRGGKNFAKQSERGYAQENPEQQFEVYDTRTGETVSGPYKSARTARIWRDKRDLAYGAVRYGVREANTGNSAKSPETPYGGPPNQQTNPKQTPPNGGVSASVPSESKFRKAQRIYQDQLNRFTVIQDWLKANGVKLGNKHDVYRAEERMYGKIAARIEDFRTKQLQPLIVQIHKAGFNMHQIGEYLVANHAAERNAQIARINPDAVDDHGNPNGSGMTDAEAQIVLDRYKALPDAAGFEKLAEQFRAITDDTKQILLGAGIISKEMADAWDAAYQHYVPLRGGPSEPTQGQATGKGLSVNSRGERRRAMGHQARDEWVVENIIHAHERAIYLAEKNRVGQYLASLVAAVPDSRLWTIDKPVKRKVLKPGQSTYVVEHKGATVGSFDTRKEADLFITAMVSSANKTPSDFTVARVVGDPQVAYMANSSLADNEVQIYVKGNTVRIQLNDPLLARAYKKMGQTHLVGVLELGRQVNAFLSKAYTGLNPEFIVSNMQRDLISGLMNITGEAGAGIAAKTLKNWLPSLRDMLRYSTTGKASAWVRMYREDGGNTGAAYLSDLERIGKDVQTAYEEAVGVRQLFGESKPAKATRVALKKSLRLVTGWIEHMNAAAENGMRVALYRSMVESGQGRAAAAAAAKNSTVNFNRKGEIGSQLSALYLFANPSIQGAASMAHALFKGNHRGQAWVMMGALAGLAYMLALGYGDDDEWDEVPQYEKDHNLLMRIGDKVVKIAVPYGQGVAFALGNAIYDLQRGKDVTEEAYHMASSMLENLAPLNPLGDKPDMRFALTELTPFEPLRIFARVANNMSGFGRQIMPESKFDESRPDFLKEYRNTYGSVYDQITRGMSKATGGTATQAGAIDVSPETLKFLWESATGGTGRFFIDTAQAARLAAQGSLPEIQETPILRKFARDANRPADARARFWDAVNRADTVLQDFRRAKNGKDSAAADRFQGMELSGLSRVVARYKDVSGEARDAVAQINAMDDKTPAEKRLMTFEIEKRERELYRAMVRDINNRIGGQ